MRNFWPVGGDAALVRPGGHLRLIWGDRWEVEVDGSRATINGRHYGMPESATYMINEGTGEAQRLKPGGADPVVLP